METTAVLFYVLFRMFGFFARTQHPLHDAAPSRGRAARGRRPPPSPLREDDAASQGQPGEAGLARLVQRRGR